MKPQAPNVTVCTARGYKALYQYDVLAGPATVSNPRMCIWRFAKDTQFAEGNYFGRFVYIIIQAFCIDVSRILYKYVNN